MDLQFTPLPTCRQAAGSPDQVTGTTVNPSPVACYQTCTISCPGWQPYLFSGSQSEDKHCCPRSDCTGTDGRRGPEAPQRLGHSAGKADASSEDRAGRWAWERDGGGEEEGLARSLGGRPTLNCVRQMSAHRAAPKPANGPAVPRVPTGPHLPGTAPAQAAAAVPVLTLKRPGLDPHRGFDRLGPPLKSHGLFTLGVIPKLGPRPHSGDILFPRCPFLTYIATARPVCHRRLPRPHTTSRSASGAAGRRGLGAGRAPPLWAAPPCRASRGRASDARDGPGTARTFPCAWAGSSSGFRSW